MIAKETIELSEGWEFRKSGENKWKAAVVPGCVQTDLFRLGEIEDPFYGTNAKKLQWIEEENWEYRLIFNVSKDIIQKNVIKLQFDGIDTYASVYLNGNELIRANNMFHDWSSACKGRIQEGENEIRVIFQSPYNKGIELLEQYGLQLPANNDTRKKKVSPYIRKSPYNFGWDWGPRIVTTGIWRKVYLQAWDIAQIQNLQIIQEDINENLANIKALFEIRSIRKYNASINIHCNNEVFSEKKIKIKEGVNLYEVPIEIEGPELWWPNGLGNPYLYNLECDLSVDNEVVDHISESIGLRTVELIREPDKLGSSFHFEVNGKEVFMKGANVIPFDYFPTEVTKEKYNTIVNAAVDANFNMLRAWGGAFYEDDYFYKLCDQKGLLVWQDFMFACGMYPATDDFLQSVKTEAIYTIKRLRNHPCIAIWCGNNEIVEGFHTWGWKEDLGKDTGRAWNDYLKVFRDLLPSLLRKHAPKKQYWPSSPGNASNEPPLLTTGDYHYWDIVKEDIPLTSYDTNVGRFMSEYGFKAYPELKTLKTYSKEKDWDIRNEVMLYHEGWERGADLIETNMNREFRKPKDFHSFLYVNQVLQAEALKVAIEAHRRHKP